MKPSEVTVILEKMLVNKKPCLLVGPPGCGKSDLVSQACEKIGADLMISHPVVEDPTNAKGFPTIIDGKAKFLPFDDLERVINYKGKLLVWFLDDLGQAPPSVQAAYMQLLLARRINGFAIPENVVFVAATNRRADRAGVSGVLEPVKSRFHSIIQVEPDLDDFVSWGLKNNVRKEVIACLRLYPELLVTPMEREIKNSACPRTWSFASDNLSMDFSGSVLPEVLSGAIGEGPAASLYGMISIFKDLPSIKKIVDDPENTEIPNNPSSLHALCTVLSRAVANKPEIVDNVLKYVEKMPGDFSVILMRDILTMCPDIANTKAFQTWSANNVDLFV